MFKAIKKLSEVSCIKWTGYNQQELIDFVNSDLLAFKEIDGSDGYALRKESGPERLYKSQIIVRDEFNKFKAYSEFEFNKKFQIVTGKF